MCKDPDGNDDSRHHHHHHHMIISYHGLVRFAQDTMIISAKEARLISVSFHLGHLFVFPVAGRQSDSGLNVC